MKKQPFEVEKFSSELDIKFNSIHTYNDKTNENKIQLDPGILPMGTKYTPNTKPKERIIARFKM